MFNFTSKLKYPKAFSIYLLSGDLEFTKILKTAHRLVLENHGTRDFLKNVPNSASPQILRPPLTDVAAMTSWDNNPYLYGSLFPVTVNRSDRDVFRFFFSPDIIFSTAHKAKGLEFDHVRVAEDYLSGLDSGIYLSELTTCSACVCFPSACTTTTS